MTTRDKRVEIPRGSILLDPKTKVRSRPHGKIRCIAITAADFTTACVREGKSDAIDVAK